MQLLRHFDEYLVHRENWDQKSHHPSGATACRRQMYWGWTGEPESDPVTPGGALKMAFGSAAELIYAKALDWQIEQNIVNHYEREESVKTNVSGLEYPISGRIDFIVTPTDGSAFGVEMKSSFGRGIVEIQKTKRPKPEHLIQVYPYMLYSRWQEFRLIYLARDNGYRTEFILKLDGENVLVQWFFPDGNIADGVVYEVKWDTFLEKFAYIEKCVVDKTLPDRDFIVAIKNGEIKDKYAYQKTDYKSDWQCRYCRFQTRCWSELLPDFATSNNSEDFKIHKEDQGEKVSIEEKPAPITSEDLKEW